MAHRIFPFFLLGMWCIIHEQFTFPNCCCCDQKYIQENIWKGLGETGGFPGGSLGTKSTCNSGDTGVVGLIPGLVRTPRGGNGNPLQYSCRELPWTEKPDGVWSMCHKESQSQTWLKRLRTQACMPKGNVALEDKTVRLQRSTSRNVPLFKQWCPHTCGLWILH